MAGCVLFPNDGFLLETESAEERPAGQRGSRRPVGSGVSLKWYYLHCLSFQAGEEPSGDGVGFSARQREELAEP